MKNVQSVLIIYNPNAMKGKIDDLDVEVRFNPIGEVTDIITEKGEINFEVNCINENNISSLVISVEDSGRGISPDKIDKLFYDILIDFIGIECRNFSGKNYVEPLTGKIWRMDCIDLTYFYLEIQRRTGIKIENKTASFFIVMPP